MGSTRRAFTDEYKRNAVSLVLEDGRTVADVARGIGMKPQTLGRWVQKIREETGGRPEPPDLKKTEREELEQLREEVAHLRMQVEFAKKVSAWFARGQR
jgi:transposase